MADKKTKKVEETETKKVEETIEEKLKEVESSIPDEWRKLAIAEAESFEKADLSSLAFFKESREVLANVVDRKGMTKRLDFWIDNSFASKGVVNRLKRIVKLASDSIEYSVGVQNDADHTHIDINLDLIYFYNLEEVIRLKKLMAKEFAKNEKERLVSGRKIKAAQTDINACLEETDKLRYNNKLTDVIDAIKKTFGVIDDDNYQIKVDKRIQQFENWLKSFKDPA